MVYRSLSWSKTEKTIARKAYLAAYERECRDIAERVRAMAAGVSGPEGLWKVHDYLTEQREDIDAKYDYRYSVLITVFAGLLNEGWVTEEDLAGLSDEKLDMIRTFASCYNE